MNFIIEFITTYGIIPGGILLALLLLWYFRKPLYKCVTRRVMKHRRSYPLSYHTFFLRMDSWMRYDINHIPFTDPFRKAVFNDFLSIKFDCCKKTLAEFVAREKLWKDKHPNEIKDEIITLLMECVAEYEEKARLKGIPEEVIAKFNKWHRSRVKVAISGIKAITASQFYISNLSRVAAILDIFTITFHDTILDAERTLKDLNGDLDGMVYNGHVCPSQDENTN